MAVKVACRQCSDEAETSQGVLPDGWWYTKTEDELSAARGKPTYPKSLQPHLAIINRRRLYDD